MSENPHFPKLASSDRSAILSAFRKAQNNEFDQQEISADATFGIAHEQQWHTVKIVRNKQTHYYAFKKPAAKIVSTYRKINDTARTSQLGKKFGIIGSGNFGYILPAYALDETGQPLTDATGEPLSTNVVKIHTNTKSDAAKVIQVEATINRRFYNVGELFGNSEYLFLRYLPGQHIFGMEQNPEKYHYPLLKRLEIINEAIENFSKLHKFGFIHSDIKSENIHVDTEAAHTTSDGEAFQKLNPTIPTVSLLDFGLIQSVPDDPTQQVKAEARGSPISMPPEFYEHKAGLKSDVYSLVGLILAIFGCREISRFKENAYETAYSDFIKQHPTPTNAPKNEKEKERERELEHDAGAAARKATAKAGFYLGDLFQHVITPPYIDNEIKTLIQNFLVKMQSNHYKKRPNMEEVTRFFRYLHNFVLAHYQQKNEAKLVPAPPEPITPELIQLYREKFIQAATTPSAHYHSPHFFSSSSASSIKTPWAKPAKPCELPDMSDHVLIKTVIFNNLYWNKNTSYFQRNANGILEMQNILSHHPSLDTALPALKRVADKVLARSKEKPGFFARLFGTSKPSHAATILSQTIIYLDDLKKGIDIEDTNGAIKYCLHYLKQDYAPHHEPYERLARTRLHLAR